jgi:multiple sugar transport system permease protein
MLTPSHTKQLKQLGRQSSLIAVVAFFTVFAAFPFYWMLITTFKRTGDLYNLRHNPFTFNDLPTWEHLQLLFFGTLFPRWLLNTFAVGAIVVCITLCIAVPAAYSLARLVGRWGESLGIGIFLTYLVPPTLLFIPLSRVIATLRLQDSLWSLVVVYPSFTIPFCTWLLMGFFRSIPRDIEEAARVDGCSRLGAIVRIVLPLSLAGILTVIIFTFTLVMQEFVYGLTFITSASQKTISVGVPTDLVRGDVYYWGPLMAGCLLSSVPVAILYNVFLDRFIAGFTMGAIK